jgi:DNA-binding transcriptional LysR family regulator
MDVRQIRYFVAACHGGSLSAAARELGVSVQAASKAIAELEREMGEPIFSRSDKGVNPTPFGLGLLARAEVFMEAFHELEAYAKDPEGAGSASKALPENACLKAGICVPSVEGIDRFMPRLAAGIERAVGVPVTLSTMPTPDGLERVRAGELDCVATIGTVHEDDLDCVSLGGLRVGVFLSSKHPLAGEESVTLEQLSAYPALWSQEFDTAAGSLLNTFRAHGLTSELLKPATYEERAQMVLEANAFFFSVYLPMLHQYDEDVVLVPISEKDAARISLCLVTSRMKKSPAYRVFEHAALENLASLFAL